jgi:predicted secreted protein
MTALAGKGGAVTFKGSGSHVNVVGVKAWKIDIKADTAETTEMASDNSLAWRTFLSTLKGWTGSIDLAYVDMTDTNGQKMLYDKLGDIAYEAVFDLDSSHELTGNIIITGFPVECSIDGVEGSGVSVSFQGTGAIAYT